MNDLLTVLVFTALLSIIGYYESNSNIEKDKVNNIEKSYIQDLKLLRDSLNNECLINLRIRQFISGSAERNLRKDSMYLYLIGKKN